eukprot:symbB.v1.2.012288.t2/scaffold847.1/size158198/3
MIFEAKLLKRRRRSSRSRAPERSPVRLRPETMLLRNRPEADGAPRVLFLMGLPGAGKSTVKRQRLRPDDWDIEPDKIKRKHHCYCEDMGEETDEEVHRWSVRRSVDEFEDAVRSNIRPNVVFDSSGSNAQWLRHRIDLAKRKGYVTELLWVDVPVEIAMLRNRNRGFQHDRRGQFCPEKIILDKAKVLESSFQELSKCVDVAERMQNWSEDSHELEEAKEDIYLYPAPRTRPPALRPGMKHYSEAPDGARAPSPSAGSRRKLRIGPWKRNDEVTKNKNARLAWMDRVYRGDREYYVDKHVLGSRQVLLERNKFPYELPPGAEHWTIWSRKQMDHQELCEYVEAWLDAREPHQVVSWNYDDNRGRRTINIWHVHIYFQGRGGQPPKLVCPNQHEEEEEPRFGPVEKRSGTEMFFRFVCGGAAMVQDNRIKTDGKVPKGLHVLDGKSVYLLMPDRFARSGAAAANTSSCSGNGWCNGTLKGITEHLDYIKGTLVPCHPKR